MKIDLISKKTHNSVTQIDQEKIKLKGDSVVVVNVNQSDIKSIQVDGRNLVITLNNGEMVVIENFFKDHLGNTDHTLVLNPEGSNELHWVKFTQEQDAIQIEYQMVEDIEPFLYDSSDFNKNLLWALPAVGGAGAIIAIANHSDNDDDGYNEKPLIVKPDTPTGYYDNVGDKTGVITDGSPTDDSRPGIPVGNLPDGYEVDLLVDGEKVPSTYDPETGYITPNNPIPDGEHDITIEFTAPNGNTNQSDPLELTVDTSPVEKPDTPTGYYDDMGDQTGVITDGSPTDDSRPGIPVGDLPDGYEVDLLVDGEKVPSTYDPETGYITPNNPIPDGDHDITIEFTAPNGNTNQSDPLELTVDTSPVEKPDTPTGYYDDVGGKTGVITDGSPTDDSRPGIPVGDLPDGYEVDLLVDGEKVPSTYDPETGYITPNNPIPDGDHDITIEFTAPNGNTNQSDPLELTVDTSPVVQPMVSPQNYFDNVGDVQGEQLSGTTTDDSLPGINVGDLPAGHSVDLWVNGNKVPSTYDPETGYLTPTQALPDGSHDLTYTYTNATGNESDQSPPLSLTVDTSGIVRPPIPQGYFDDVGDVQGPQLSGSTTDDNLPDLMIGQIPEGDTVDLWVDGKKVESTYDSKTGYLTPTTPLGEGSHNLTYTYSNPAGNTSNPSLPLVLIVDTTAVKDPLNAPSGYFDDVGDVQGEQLSGTTTDDEIPNLIIGQIPPGYTVDLWVDNTKVPSTYDPETGYLTPKAPLGDGLHDLTYTYTNPAGNVSNPSPPLSLTLDTSGVVRPPAPQGYFDDVGDVQGPQLSGSTTDDNLPDLIIGPIPAGDTVDLWVDGKKVDSTYNPQTGYLTPTKPLTEGQHTLTYTYSNPAGNTSNQSPKLELTVDTSPVEKPDTPTSYYDDVGGKTGVIKDGSPTDDSRPGIPVGDLPDGYEVDLLVDGEKVPSTYDPETGYITPNNPIPDGEHDITIEFTAPNGNTNQSDPLELTVDTSPVQNPPNAPSGYFDDVGIVQGEQLNGSTTDDTVPDLMIDPIPPGYTVDLWVNGNKVPSTYDPETGYLTPTSPLGDGSYDLTYTYTNATGNVSEPSPPLSLTVDTSNIVRPPVPEGYFDDVGDVQGPQLSGSTTDDNLPDLIIGQIPEGDTVDLWVDGVKVDSTYDSKTGYLTPTTSLGEGSHNLTYTYTNPAGNVSGQSPQLTLTVDTTAVKDPLNAPSGYFDDVGDVQGEQLSGTTTDDEIPNLIIGQIPPGYTVDLWVDNTKVPSTYDPETGYLTPKAPLGDGPHTLTYTYTNPAGNVSNPSPPLNLTVDTSNIVRPPAPQGYFDDVGDVTGIQISGTTTDDTLPDLIIGPIPEGDTVDLWVDGKKVDSTYNPQTGYLTPTKPLTEGQHTLTYTYSNPAGNTSNQSPKLELTVDTSPVEKPDTPTSYYDDVGGKTGVIKDGSPTDDSRPGIPVGDLPTGYEADLLVDGEKVPSTYDPETGYITPNDPIPDGDHDITIEFTAPNGNTNQSDPLDLTVDTSPVQNPPNAPSGYFDDVGIVQGPQLSGTTTDDTVPDLIIGSIPPGYTVDLWVDGTKVPSTYNPQTGYLTPKAPLGGGSHDLTYTYTNATGNVSDQSPSLNLTVDTSNIVRPSAPQGYFDDVGDVQGPQLSGSTTDDTVPDLIIGSIPPGYTVDLWVDGTKVSSTYDPVKGYLTPTVPLGSGQHTLTYTYTNPAGNVSGQSPQLTLTVDTSAVQDPLNAPSGYFDDVGDVQGLQLSGSTTDDAIPDLIIGRIPAGYKVDLWVDGKKVESTYDPVKGYLTPKAPLGDGPHTLTYTYTNPAGNVSKPSPSLSLTVDTSAVEEPLNAPSGYFDDVGTVTGIQFSGSTTDDEIPDLIIGTIPLGYTVDLLIDGKKVESTYDPVKGYLTPKAPLGDGPHTLTYTYTNPAGNVSDPSPSLTLTVDTSTIVRPSDPQGYFDNVGDVQGIQLSGTTTDDNLPDLIIGSIPVGDTVDLWVDGIKVGSTYDPVKGYLTPTTPLSEGLHNLTYTYTNPVGNVSSPSRPLVLTVDTSPVQDPLAPSGYFDDVGYIQGIQLSGTTTDDEIPDLIIGRIPSGYDVDLLIDGKKVDSIYNPQTGYLTPTVPLAEGSHTLTYIYTNPAGNVSKPSPPLTLTVSTDLPDVSEFETTLLLNLDTANGVPTSGLTNSKTALNNDLITRDSTPTLVSGVLTEALLPEETLYISINGGTTWTQVTTLLNQKTWTFTLTQTYTQDTVLNVRFKVMNAESGTSSIVPGTGTNITIDLTSPDTVSTAPVIGKNIDVNDIVKFDSDVYGVLEAGATVALVNDVNNNSMWQEGIDSVVASATVGADGKWSLSTLLPEGALNLGFVVWDKAGNVSAMSSVKNTGVSSTENGSDPVLAKWGGTTDGDNYGVNAAAATINANGTWSFFQSAGGVAGSADRRNAGRVYSQDGSLEDYTSAYLEQPSTTNGAGYNLNGGGYGHYINSAVFADINRDGLVDVMSQVSDYHNSNRTAYWLQQADGSWGPRVVDQGTLNHLGGAIAYDRTGDGYLDFVLADSAADSLTFLKNNSGVLSYELNGGQNGRPPSGELTIANGLNSGSVTGVSLDTISTKLNLMHEIGAVDLDNNGTIDITGHSNYRNLASGGNNGQDLAILYNSGTEQGFTLVRHTYVFAPDAGTDRGNLTQSMTWADFNGDGWLDLYLNRGANNGTNQTGDSNESRMYLNDGTGKLLTSKEDTIWFGDTMKGGTSFAVDWDFDGKMDVIEVPAYVNNQSGFTVAGSPILYTNTGANSDWGKNGISLTGSTTYKDVTGAIVVDYDWDGSLDLLLYHAAAIRDVNNSDSSNPTTIVRNANTAADGSVLHVRILDGFGINTFYSNTVKLYNSAGELVSTQLINPQSSGSSNSMGLLSFYGLNPNDTYSVQLLRITNGVTNHVSGVATLGGFTHGTINSSWSGLKTGKANEAYVLTAESDTAVNNSGVNSVGIVGTGYNDHFFGTLGNDHYNGGGGWVIKDGVKEWLADGGEDVLDYSLLNSTITVDVTNKTVTKVSNGVTSTDTFVNIEKFITGSGDTVFNAAPKGDHVFVGGQGNDTYNLGSTHTGDNTIYLTLLNAMDATGGNGVDKINGFKIGQDIIDIHELLSGYEGSVGMYQDSDGSLKLNDSSANLLDYLEVSSDGTNTYIKIDRDGAGSQYDLTTLLVLNNLNTNLITLLDNNQIIV